MLSHSLNEHAHLFLGPSVWLVSTPNTLCANSNVSDEPAHLRRLV